MTNKPMTDRAQARMYFKRWKAGMAVSPDEVLLIQKWYPFMRTATEER